MLMPCVWLVSMTLQVLGGVLASPPPPSPILPPFLAPARPLSLYHHHPSPLMAALNNINNNNNGQVGLIDSPQHLRKRVATSAPSTEVVWGSCAPRRAHAKRSQDARLQCEATVPPGTSFTWYKDSQVLQRPGVTVTPVSAASLLESLEEETNMVGLTAAPSASASFRRVVSTTVYLDCITDQDAGEYMLEVRTATNNVYFRNFTLILSEMGQSGASCSVEASVRQYIPRIYQFAWRLEASVGASVTLPCRAQGYSISTAWFKNNLSLPQPNYQVLSNGDLVIVNVDQGTFGTYQCRVSSTLAPDLTDSTFTALQPITVSTS